MKCQELGIFSQINLENSTLHQLNTTITTQAGLKMTSSNNFNSKQIYIIQTEFYNLIL